MSHANRPLQQFPAVSQAQWREELDALLGPGKFERRLVSRTREGLEVQPLYADQGESPTQLPWRATRGWRAEVDVDGGGDKTAARDALRRDLKHGVLGLRFFDLDPADLSFFLEDVDLSRVSVHFQGGEAQQLATALLAHAEAAGFAPDQLRGGLGADGAAATAELVTWSTEALPEFRPVRVSTVAAAEAGAGEALEVALALSAGVEKLEEWSAAGLSLELCARALEFELSVGTDVFLELAKLRALRLAWGRALAACGLSPEHRTTTIAARASARAWSARDPWVNLLRGTTTTFAAAIGGADSFTLLPYDACLGESDAEARRLAANTQAILARESHLGAVEDAAAGSGYLEELTESLARAAWERFCELQRAGGFSVASESGLIERLTNEARQAQESSVRTRSLGLVGVSEFPNLSEELPQRPPRRRTLSAQRLAAPFEALRARSDAHLERTGSRPRAFLANFGSIPEHLARATFATNLLAAGGVEAIPNDGFEEVAAAVEAFRASGTSLCVITSSDARYLECVEPLARALVAAGATVALAGRPGEHEPAWRAAGVQHFLHLGCDAVASLESLHSALGVAS